MIKNKAHEAVIIKWLERQDYRYHTLIKPKYTDKKYDAKKDLARKMYPKNPYFSKVGAPIAPGRVKVKLDVLVGSLEKLTPNEVDKWVSNTKASYKATTFLIWPKLDGISLTLHYRDGILIAAYKKGDGSEAEDIIINAKYIQGALRKLKPTNSKRWPHKGDIYIRGEAVIHKKIFNKYFAESIGGKYKTCRNFCGGMLNTLPNKKTKELPKEVTSNLKKMTFVAFSMVHKLNKKEVSYEHTTNVHAAMSAWGLTVISNPSRYNVQSNKWFAEHDYVDWSQYTPVFQYDNMVKDWVIPFDLKNITEEYILLKMQQYANDVDIDQDGIVIEICDHKVQKKMGYFPNGKTPKAIMAIKPEKKDQLTLIGRVADIKLEFSSRRIYTPVITLKKSLNFNGVAVNSITGHNVGLFLSKGIDVGSKVKIVRSGQVIPHCMGLADGQVKVAKPSWLIRNCIHCETRLKWSHNKKGGKVNLYCPNEKCSGYGFETLDRFFSKIKIDGLARKVLQNMAAQGIDTIPKVLRVTEKQLSKVEGFAKKKTANILAGIKKATGSADLAVIAGASGIFANEKHGLDAELLRPVIEKMGKVKFLSITNPSDINAKILGVPNMGRARISLLIEKLPEFQKFYSEIDSLIKLEDKKLVSTKLAGKTFVFTNFRSSELEDYIRSNGGKVSGSVSGKTTAVLYGPGSSGKLTKANNLKVKSVEQAKAKEYLTSLTYNV